MNFCNSKFDLDSQQVECKECGVIFQSQKSLHFHLKKHNIPTPEYYLKHYPRKDLLTGENIPFKSLEFYFGRDFVNKINMNKWFNNSPQEDKKEYCEYLLKGIREYQINKRLSCAPSQVELRTLFGPSIPTFEKILEKSWDLICRDHLHLDPKFNYLSSNDFLINDLGKLKILIDTREQHPLKFSCISELSKLDFGDYVAAGNYYGSLFIERKSLQDFLGTMTMGYERFNAEIKRAAEFESYIVVLVESRFSQAEGFQYLPHIHSKAKPEFIFHRLREICRYHKNAQFLFVDGRIEASKIIQKIFLQKDKCKKIDLQHRYDTKKLCG